MRHCRTWIATSVLLLAPGLQAFGQQPAASPYPPIQPDQARPMHTFVGLEGPGAGLAYAEAEGILVACAQNRALHYWLKPEILGIKTGELTPHVFKGHEGPITSLAWSGGPILASAGADQRIQLWSMPAATHLASIDPKVGIIRALAMSADGATLACAGDEPVITLWNLQTRELERKLEGHSDAVIALCFSPDGHYLASSGYDQSIRIWNLSGPDKIPVIPIKAPQPADPPVITMSVAFSPDGKLLAVGGTDGQIRLLDAASGNQVRALPGHTSSVTCLSWHPTGNVLLSGSRDRTVRLWNPGNGQALKTLEGHQSWVNGLVLLNQGSLAATVSADQSVRIWDLRPMGK